MSSTIAQGTTVTEVCEAMQDVLTEEANRLARPTGLIERQRKFNGAQFAQMLVLGWLHDPQAGLESLVQFGSSLGIDLTAQGLDQRFTVQAATFLHALLESAIGHVITADPVAIPLLQRFSAVVLEDSSTITLPDELAGIFEGCGGSTQEGTMAALKLQLRLDLLRGGRPRPVLQAGRASDYASPLLEQLLPVGALHITDRGYFDLERMQQEREQGSYSLTYLKNGVQLFDEQGQPLDLLLLLAGSAGRLERSVLAGQEQRLPMRLVAVRVPTEIAKQRRKHLRQVARDHGRTLSHEQDLLAGWTVVLTNAPCALLSLQEALVLLRARWQIELLWKLWKQDGSLDAWRSQQPWRILCELYAKLLGLLIQHWLLLLGCWQEPHRSLVKAAKAVRSHAILLAYALAGALTLDFVVEKIQGATRSGSRLNTRKTHPNTSQLLLDGLDWPLT
jgi:hypothetical protein